MLTCQSIDRASRRSGAERILEVKPYLYRERPVSPTLSPHIGRQHDPGVGTLIPPAPEESRLALLEKRQSQLAVVN